MQDIIKIFKFKDNGVIMNAPTALETEFVKIGFIAGTAPMCWRWLLPYQTPN
jgi:hypothetical protein